MTPLPQDYGPWLHAQQRAEREWQERPFWERVQLWHIGCVAVVLLVVGISLTGAAYAYDYPPEEYTHAPTVEVAITHQTLGETMRDCERLINETGRWGCMRFIGETCVVYLPEQGGAVSWASYERMRVHELAHCNGWAHPVRGNRVLPTLASNTPNTQDRDQ